MNRVSPADLDRMPWHAREKLIGSQHIVHTGVPLWPALWDDREVATMRRREILQEALYDWRIK